MGFFDFLFKKKSDGERVIRESRSETKKVINGIPMTFTATTRLSVVDSDEYGDTFESDDDYEIPKDTLRELKTYSERVDVPCGFDFSDVRRWHGQRGAWWAEGDNYDKIFRTMDAIRNYQDEARETVPDFPDVIGTLMKWITPYSKGADGNHVPYIFPNITKKRGSCIDAVMNARRFESGPSYRMSILFGSDGEVVESVAEYRDKKAKWSMRVAYDKRAKKLMLKSASKEVY